MNTLEVVHFKHNGYWFARCVIPREVKDWRKAHNYAIGLYKPNYPMPAIPLVVEYSEHANTCGENPFTSPCFVISAFEYASDPRYAEAFGQLWYVRKIIS